MTIHLIQASNHPTSLILLGWCTVMRVTAIYIQIQVILILTTIIHIHSRDRGIASLSLLNVKSKSIGKKKNEKIQKAVESSGDSDAKDKQNVVHDANSKINIASVDSNSTDTSISIDAIIQKQTTFIATQQMILSIASMALSRYIFKLDFKNKETVILCRMVFCTYLLLSQLLSFILTFKVCR